VGFHPEFAIWALRERGFAAKIPHSNLNAIQTDTGNSMAVPKRKHSNARTGSRRAHDSIKPRPLTVCSKCSTTIPTHVVCPTCGFYMGRVVTPNVEEASAE
jgi:large subunit ribosomal protein L32